MVSKSTNGFANYHRTKILATVGPATNSYELIKEMISAGANGLRLNFSHGTYDNFQQQIVWIRKASRVLKTHVAIVQDLQGPKVRLGSIEEDIPIRAGQIVKFAYKGNYEQDGIVPLQYDLSNKVKRGHRFLVDDGSIHLRVTLVRDGVVYARTTNSGRLRSKKGINLPDTDFAGDIITKKDKQDIMFGSGQDIDYVALSFVQTAKDLKYLKRLLKNAGSSAKVIAKIETKAALDNIDEIIKECDGVMIARGDLATEVSPEAVPVAQRQIIEKTEAVNAISIVATQMLMSMTTNPSPTRAEASDVATAAELKADCVMLSDETANGEYPIQSVKTMSKILIYTESQRSSSPTFLREFEDSMAEAIPSAIIALAYQIRAKAIVAETASGRTAVNIASRRPNMPIVMVTNNIKTAQQLALVYGGVTYERPIDEKAATKLTNWLCSKGIFTKGDRIVTASGQYPGISGGTDTIKVREI